MRRRIIMAKNITIKAGGLNYPEAINWMWDYCIHLGKYTASDGKKYDLGVYEHRGEDVGVSYAIVFDNEPGSYISGTMSGPIEDMAEGKYKETALRYSIYLKEKNNG
jgi:hypothetical protein